MEEADGGVVSATSTTKSTSEYSLDVDGYACPTEYMNDFTPQEFGEVVETFKKYDIDESRTIDVHELRQLMADLELDSTEENAADILGEIDSDGGGELEFEEFCVMLARIKRGDDKLKGFAALTEELNQTPLALLDEQCSKRDLKVRYQIVEEREATSMHPAYYVMAVHLTGEWFEMIDGVATSSHCTKIYEGIGKTTREAKYKSATAALTKLRSLMPGLKFSAGVIPSEWLDWCLTNFARGVPSDKVLDVLVAKGFAPCKNHALMQRVTCLRSIDEIINDDPTVEHITGEGQKISNELQAWVGRMLRRGVDGAVLVKVLEDRGFNPARNPGFVARLRNNAGGSICDPVMPKLRDFWAAVTEGHADDCFLYLRGGQDPSECMVERHGSTRQRPLALAAEHGNVGVLRVLIDGGASTESTDNLGRTAMHYAAKTNQTGALEYLMERGASLHAIDTYGNTPLHTSAVHANPEAAEVLCFANEENVRKVLTAKERVSEKPLREVMMNCFTELVEQKLSKHVTQRFEKRWVLDAAKHCHLQLFAEKRHLLADPTADMCQYVLNNFDPDPESGFWGGTKGDPTWVPTVAEPSHLVGILQNVFKQAAINRPNRIGRTPAHVAAFENRCDSHEAVLRVLLDDHGANSSCVDTHKRCPYDLVVMRRGRPKTPTGTELAEELISERRDLLLDKMKAETDRDEAERLARERADFLRKMCAVGTKLTEDGWAVMVEASGEPRRTLGGWDEYEDIDTQNQYYFREGQAEGGGLGRWDKPAEFAAAEQRKQGFAQLRNRSTFVRSLGAYDVILDDVTGEQVFVHSETDDVSWLKPVYCKWASLVAVSEKVKNLGAAEEWGVYRDPNGNIFYHKELEHDTRWERPLDATEKQNIEKCTRTVYGDEKHAQSWYQLGGLALRQVRRAVRKIKRRKEQQRRPSMAERRRASKATREAQKLLEEAKADVEAAIAADAGEGEGADPESTPEQQLLEGGGGGENSNSKGGDDSASEHESDGDPNDPEDPGNEMLKVCLGCSKLCWHDWQDDGGQEQLKFGRISSIHCMCHASGRCQNQFDPVKDREERKAVADQTEEINRVRARRVAEPCYLARVPSAFAPGATDDWIPFERAKRFAGWHLCRRVVNTTERRGWVNLIDPESPTRLPVGATVLVPRRESVAKVPAEILKRRSETSYDVRYADGDIETFIDRDDIEASGFPFWFHIRSGYSTWEEPGWWGEAHNEAEPSELFDDIGTEDDASVVVREIARQKWLDAGGGQKKRVVLNGVEIELDDEYENNEGEENQLLLLQEQRGGDSIPRSHSHRVSLAASLSSEKNPPVFPDESKMPEHVFPDLSGTDWEEIAKTSKIRRHMAGYEEHEEIFTNALFYYDPETADLEAAARQLQKIYRTKFGRPVVRRWESQAYSFIKPAPFAQEEGLRVGWAVIRRRSKFIREVKDKDRVEWEELADPVSGEHFFFCEGTGESSFLRPPPPDKTDPQLQAKWLFEGDTILARFKQSANYPAHENAAVVKVRADDETGERMYDVVQELPKTSIEKPLLEKWVRREMIRRPPKSREEVQMEQEEREWRAKLARQRNADERREARDREALEKEMAKKRRGNRKKKAKKVRSEAEIAQARARRAAAEAAALEAARLEEEEKAAEEARLAAALLQGASAGAIAAAVGGGGLSGAAAKNADTDKFEMMKAKAAEANKRRFVDEKRLAEEAREAALEKKLSGIEDRSSTPRTKHRRRVLRLIVNAVRRQKHGFVICEWGCGCWTKKGKDQHVHEKERCPKRLIKCTLGCGLTLREEEWVAPFGEKALGAAAMNFQQQHEEVRCPRRLVPCDLKCGEWIPREDLPHHMKHLCIKRPIPALPCRLGCGALFQGGAHRMLQCEEERLEHENEICPYRMVRCTWPKCVAMVRATDRSKHRREHIESVGISIFTVPMWYTYKVPIKTRQLKVQLWGGGGGSGHIRNREGGGGGGGAMVEALLNVTPGEKLELCVGGGGQEGVHGTLVQVEDENDAGVQADVHLEDRFGVALGGQPGGGNGHGGNKIWAAGGGGGYSMVQRHGPTGMVVLLVASGGGGGASRTGVSGGGLHGEPPGSRIDKRNGRLGTQTVGGSGGDCGSVYGCSFPSEDGQAFQGGNGAEYGGGGGGGYFGGGGGGTSPGIVGGGGGGSCYVNWESVQDAVVLSGVYRMCGGAERKPPMAVGVGEWDLVGGFAGEGGEGSGSTLEAGNAGAIRIFKPGFYDSK